MFDGIVKRMKWRFGIVLILLVVVALLVVQSEIDMRERTALR